MGLCACFNWITTNITAIERYGSRVDHFSVLPNEILEIIFSHIRPKHLIENVAPVCRRFHYVISNEKWWNIMTLKHPLNITLCDATKNSQGFSAVRTYDAILSNEKLRKNWETQKRHIVATGEEWVDKVRLFRKGNETFCLAGVKALVFPWNTEPDLAIQLWSIDTLTQVHHEGKAARPITGTGMTHRKFITGLELYRDSEQFLSSSDDGSVRLWDMGNGGITPVDMKSNQHAVHSISVQDRMVACTTGPIYSDDIAIDEPSFYLLDAGNGFQEIARVHYPAFAGNSSTTSVLKDNFLYISVSDSLVTVDIRNMQTPLHMQKPNRYWVSGMMYADGHIYCLESNDELHVFDAPDLSPCYSFNVSPNMYKTNGFTTLTKTRGSILVREPYRLKAFSLGPRPVLLGLIKMLHNGVPEHTLMDLDSLDQYIVAAGSGDLITWIDSDN